MTKLNVVMFGPPGSGKGTHAPFVVNKLNLDWVATGTLLRQFLAKGGPEAKKAQELLKQGKPVDNQIINDLIQ